jgi:site-specific DNA recombinase
MNGTWAIYTRVSTRQQVDGFSLQDQKEKLIAYARSQGWPWKLFEDAGVSGATLERPGLMALLEAVEHGNICGVLLVDESRLGRASGVSQAI